MKSLPFNTLQRNTTKFRDFIVYHPQSKLTCHRKKHKNVNHSQEKYQTTETHLEMVQMLDLAATDI